MNLILLIVLLKSPLNHVSCIRKMLISYNFIIEMICSIFSEFLRPCTFCHRIFSWYELPSWIIGSENLIRLFVEAIFPLEYISIELLGGEKSSAKGKSDGSLYTESVGEGGSGDRDL